MVFNVLLWGIFKRYNKRMQFEGGSPIQLGRERYLYDEDDKGNSTHPEAEYLMEHFFPKLEELYGEELKISTFEILEGDNQVTAHRICCRNSFDTAHLQFLVELDWDDTVEPYSPRKDEFISKLGREINIPDRLVTAFKEMCGVINKQARVLPSDNIHPQRYSPLLEMMAISYMIDDMEAGTQSWIETFSMLDNEKKKSELVQKLIEITASEKLEGRVGLAESHDSARFGRIYFHEADDKGLDTDFSHESIDGVDERVYRNFKEEMTASRIDIISRKLLDVPNEVGVELVTFGDKSYQPAKVTNGIEILRNEGRRLPEGLTFITRGRKKSALEWIADQYPSAKVGYFDDSLNQLVLMINSRINCLFHAIRPGAKRAHQETPPEIKRIDLNDLYWPTILAQLMGLVVRVC